MNQKQENITIRIYTDQASCKKYDWLFTNFGMKFNGKKRRYEILLPEEEDAWKKINAIKHAAQQNHLRYEMFYSRYSRSSGCRNTYFSSRTPDIGNRYFCIYCGRLLKKKNVNVDHILPVRKAETSRWVQSYMERKHWAGVNDARNLGASCRRCNSRKGAKTGIWTLRGMIGKSKLFQVFRWGCRGLLFVCIFTELLQNI